MHTPDLKSLDTLSEGSSATLVALGGERSFRMRLMELGLLPGCSLKLIRYAKVGGVLELEVRRCRLILRNGAAREIFVR
ncbi:MAG: Fe2+ transport system protein FeoA [Planctomycetota bacterium]|jgi:Fe2+ transport system protein FeoA